MLSYVCYSCEKLFHNEDRVLYQCPSCQGILGLQYPSLSAQWIDHEELGIWRYRRALPPVAKQHHVHLGEGNTALIRSRAIAEQLGMSHLYFKLESSNPTGSYKDRIAAMGIAWALEQGRQGCVGTTSGNAGAAVAAYAARMNFTYRLLVLEHMAAAKLSQVLVYGADVTKIKGFGTEAAVGDQVFAWIHDQVDQYGWEPMITAFHFNPYAMEGVKTIAFELHDQLGMQLDHVFAPMGGGGLYCGIWKGFKELHQSGCMSQMPHMVAVQPEGCSNVVRAYEANERLPMSGDSTTEISGLQVPNPPDGTMALRIMSEGEGSAVAVADEEIWRAQQALGRLEGIFCEPAGATALAGLMRKREQGNIAADSVVVCCVTGNGLKDVERLTASVDLSSVPMWTIDQLHETGRG